MSETEKIVLGGGCFWCQYPMFKELKGVKSVTSGYAGGHVENPTYKQVCSGTTGHAEVNEVVFDPNILSLEDLLGIFFTTHDPTTLNRQGNDVGTWYRSIVLYTSDRQKEIVSDVIEDLANKKKIWKDPVVTEVVPLKKFYPAEKYHQDYYENNPNQGYCRFVIEPKVMKFRKMYADKLLST